MKWFDLKKFSLLDYGLLVVFIVYIVFPISTPDALVPYIDSPLGLVFMFAVTVSLFVYTNPILGILYIFVVYEVLRRNHYHAPASPIPSDTLYMVNRVPKSIPTQKEKDKELADMNPKAGKTLEEEVIDVRAPTDKIHGTSAMVQATFHPVPDRTSLQATLV
jgi:hypothetical protein